jgi:DNA ligase (NAD+)
MDERSHNLACPNRACPGRAYQSIAYFASRGVMDIEGLSEKTALKLVEAGKVRTVADLYGLSREDLLGIEGFADISADNLLAGIRGSLARPLWRVIVALEIPQVGEATAKLLAKHFGSLAALGAATREQLLEVYSVGPLIADEILRWFVDADNAALAAALTAAGVRTEEAAPAGGDGAFNGQTVVLTGTISFATRDQLKAWLESEGATVTDSVSKKTGLLIAGPGAGSKLEKAAKLGVRVWDEAALVEHMQINRPQQTPEWWPT